MSLTQSSKDYWANEIKTILRKKQQDLLDSHGDPDYYDRVYKAAEQKVLTETGAGWLIEEYESLKKEGEKIDKNVRDLCVQINTLFGNKNGGSYPQWSDKLDWLAKAEQIKLMTDPLGQELLELNNLATSIERTIMLVSSETVLRGFLVRFLGGLGVKVPGLEFIQPGE